mmetsp:Transcript_43159/g.113362  ORF Transcript_43159/g.113362 Transcript_43159/m.113362 type:complete len:390 (+) Transcript_43159:694-1863(+)
MNRGARVGRRRWRARHRCGELQPAFAGCVIIRDELDTPVTCEVLHPVGSLASTEGTHAGKLVKAAELGTRDAWHPMWRFFLHPSAQLGDAQGPLFFCRNSIGIVVLGRLGALAQRLEGPQDITWSAKLGLTVRKRASGAILALALEEEFAEHCLVLGTLCLGILLAPRSSIISEDASSSLLVRGQPRPRLRGRAGGHEVIPADLIISQNLSGTALFGLELSPRQVLASALHGCDWQQRRQRRWQGLLLLLLRQRRCSRSRLLLWRWRPTNCRRIGYNIEHIVPPAQVDLRRVLQRTRGGSRHTDEHGDYPSVAEACEAVGIVAVRAHQHHAGASGTLLTLVCERKVHHVHNERLVQRFLLVSRRAVLDSKAHEMECLEVHIMTLLIAFL